MVFLLQIRDTEVLGPRSGIKKWIFNMILLILSPLVQPGTLLGFVYCWKTGDTKHEVGSAGKVLSFIISYQERFHFAWKQVKTINGLTGSSLSLLLLTSYYLTGVLPSPWSDLSARILFDFFSLFQF